MTPRSATLIGLTAIRMWSLLSVMTVATGKIPAFQLAAMTFAIGAAVAFISFVWRPAAFGALRQPLVAWVVGVGGLFGYHALYFLALRFAPPAEAGLLNYLWPLLIVLFSSLLPGERLAPHHVIGALLGLAGTVLLFAGNGASFAPGQIPGLAAAFVAAFVWASYSVMSRRLKAVPTDAVAGFCAATALLAAIVHGFVETTVWPETAMQWLAIVALGVGPVGGAFGRLPGINGHDRLRPLAGGKIRAEPHRVRSAAVIGDLQRERVARIIMPGLDRIDAVPVRTLAAPEQVIDHGRSRTSLG